MILIFRPSWRRTQANREKEGSHAWWRPSANDVRFKATERLNLRSATVYDYKDFAGGRRNGLSRARQRWWEAFRGFPMVVNSQLVPEGVIQCKCIAELSCRL